MINRNFPWLLSMITALLWLAASRACLLYMCDTPPHRQPSQVKTLCSGSQGFTSPGQYRMSCGCPDSFWSAVHSGCYEMQYKYTRVSQFSWKILSNRPTILSTCSDATEITHILSIGDRSLLQWQKSCAKDMHLQSNKAWIPSTRLLLFPILLDHSRAFVSELSAPTTIPY